MPGNAPRLLVATRNKGKLKELRDLLGGVPYTLVSLADAGIDHEVEETGTTFAENAALKATAYARLSGLPTLADDSGLEVDALDGEPGVYSSRYAGVGATDAQRIAYLQKRMREAGANGTPSTARFRCVIAIVMPGEPLELHEGTCEGTIIGTPRGTNGFGYDPVFLFPDLGKTMAELDTGEKNRISHRAEAARKAANSLRKRA